MSHLPRWDWRKQGSRELTPRSRETVRPDLGKTEQSPVPGPMADAGGKAGI